MDQNTRGAIVAGRRSATLLPILMLALVVVATALAPPSHAAEPDMVPVIVRELPDAGDTPERFIERTGGVVGDPLDVINGYAAELPADRVGELAGLPGVHSVSSDTTVHLLGWEDASGIKKYNPKRYDGSMYRVAVYDTYTSAYWNSGYTGEGVDIALIDSGVVPVDGLTAPGKVVNGPDLSFESQSDELRYLDTYGHGTHIAGIIAGRDDAAAGNPTFASRDHFTGIAPDARIINIKVADHEGAVDVSQVIAAIDWVVQHRDDDGMNIRVLNLSFGTDGTQDYTLDPLAYAVEQAWQAGIVVVVAAGNDGNDSPLRNPASDPFVITVGAADSHGGRQDQMGPTEFSSCGDVSRPVDLLAPGKSIVSLRNPGSYADDHYPEAVISDRFFLGSGTSQAAAVVSGAAALIIEQRPDITPDQLKALLKSTTTELPRADSLCRGSGLLNLWRAYVAPTPSVASSDQGYEPSTAAGTLDAARGTFHLKHEGVALEGEQDIFGSPFSVTSWAAFASMGDSWFGGMWNQDRWTGASWSGASWSGASWSGASWSGASWSGALWSGASWSSKSWSGASWSGGSWSGSSWSSSSWSSSAWQGLSWQ